MPSTKQMESKMLDLPEPFRPVMALKNGSKLGTAVRCAYDLKPSTTISSIYMLAPARRRTPRRLSRCACSVPGAGRGARRHDGPADVPGRQVRRSTGAPFAHLSAASAQRRRATNACAGRLRRCRQRNAGCYGERCCDVRRRRASYVVAAARFKF
jgi:hypothetical protein